MHRMIGKFAVILAALAAGLLAPAAATAAPTRTAPTSVEQQAQPASRASATQTATAANADVPTIAAVCHYRVTGDGVRVRTAPSTSATVIKLKFRGDHVTGPCYDVLTDRWWTAVYLGTGGTGWMASTYLAFIGYW